MDGAIGIVELNKAASKSDVSAGASVLRAPVDIDQITSSDVHPWTPNQRPGITGYATRGAPRTYRSVIWPACSM